MTYTENNNYSTTKLLTIERPILIQKEDKDFESMLFLPENKTRQGEGGLRTQGYFKKSYEDKPLVTVITVVYNGEAYLEETILSVINQTYDNVEYIIVDGGSTDGTLEIIKKYEKQIDYWVGEKDSGIYDAMNKGINLATGEWLNFMNAGDMFYKNSSLLDIFSFQQNADVLYSDIQMNYQNFFKTMKVKPLKTIWKGMPFSHQSMLIKRDLHKQYFYNTTYRLTADFNFVFTTYNAGFTYKYISVPLAQVSTEGVSFVQRTTVYQEYYDIVHKETPTLTTDIYFKYLLYKEKIKVFVKSLLSQNIIEIISKYK